MVCIRFVQVVRAKLESSKATKKLDMFGVIKGFSAVDQLPEFSRTDASNEYCCGPPLTALSPINNQLEEFFQNEVFGNAIFPAMECRNRKLLQDRLT